MLDSLTFANIVASTPLVSVDMVFVRGGQEVLLGLRNNRPAQGFWFVPGGRIFKDESITSALVRVAETELGLGNLIENGRIMPKLIGPFEHFYQDSFAGDIGISTHYVVLAYQFEVPDDFLISNVDSQHAELQWWTIKRALSSPLVHRFTKGYF